MLEYEFLLVFFIEDVWISGRPDQQKLQNHTFEGRKWKEVQNEGFCHLKAPIWVNALNIAQSHGEDSGGSRTFSSFCWLKSWDMQDIHKNWENMPNLWCGKPARFSTSRVECSAKPRGSLYQNRGVVGLPWVNFSARLRDILGWRGTEGKKIDIWPHDLWIFVGLGSDSFIYMFFLKGSSRLELWSLADGTPKKTPEISPKISGGGTSGEVRWSAMNLRILNVGSHEKTSHPNPRII